MEAGFAGVVLLLQAFYRGLTPPAMRSFAPGGAEWGSFVEPFWRLMPLAMILSPLRGYEHHGQAELDRATRRRTSWNCKAWIPAFPSSSRLRRDRRRNDNAERKL